MNPHINPILASFLEDNTNPRVPEHKHSPLKELPIRYFPDSILNQVCEPVAEVTEEVQELAKSMIYTLLLEKGIGLAAPQVGRLIRLFVVDVGWIHGVEHSEPRVFINPTVISTGGVEVPVHEGCLSFPGATAIVKRSTTVRVEALDLEGQPFMGDLDGLLGVVVQHEYDHLNGVTIRKALSPYELGIAQKNIKKNLRGKKHR
jgi:peptide deformylase